MTRRALDDDEDALGDSEDGGGCTEDPACFPHPLIP